jgi:hypothetical protein
MMQKWGFGKDILAANAAAITFSEAEVAELELSGRTTPPSHQPRLALM